MRTFCLRHKALPVCLLILLITVLALWFYAPKTIRKTVPLCSESGECTEITLDVTWHRRLLRPNRLYGRVTLNGQPFYSRYGYELVDGTLKKIPYELGFFTGLRQKLSGASRSFEFSTLDESGAFSERTAESTVWLESLAGESFRFLRVCVRNADGAPILFYGAATTAEEAARIASR